MQEILVILNPAARSERAKKTWKQIESFPHCTLRTTAATGDARALAEQAVGEGFTTIVAAGGDGTVNEVVNGIAGSGVALGILPVGTMNVFAAEASRYDRVVSVEMFEHMKNWAELMRRIAGWLKPGGKLFFHVFTHKDVAYHFAAKDATDWMSRHFFTGGIMPSNCLASRFQADLKLEAQWEVEGRHYGQTSEHWLENTDRHREEILRIFAQTYGPDRAKAWLANWRVFFMACAELWNYQGGTEWMVCHYRFAKRAG